MKTIFFYCALFTAILLSSCKNDGDVLQTTDELNYVSELTLTVTDITLSTANDKDSVQRITWTERPLTLNHSNYQLAKNTLTHTLQIDADSKFSNPKEIEKSDSVYLTGEVLNTFAKSQKLPVDTKSVLYCRVKTLVAANVTTVYSDVKVFSIIPYDAGADYLYIGIGPDLASLSFVDNNRLCSRSKDGKYDGFLYAASGWLNFRLAPVANAASTVYGSAPDQRFMLDNNLATQWGLWLDAEIGLHYLQADINAKTWSFINFSALNVYGEFNNWNATNTPLVWNPTTKTYRASVTFSAANSSFKLVPSDKAGTGSVWSSQLGSGTNAGELYLGGDDIKNPTAGTFILTVDLNDPAAYKYTLTTP